ncbi:MAG: rod shape-determining protein [Acidobacteriota bacterium]
MGEPGRSGSRNLQVLDVFKSLFRSADLAIDLGTINTRIHAREEGIVVNEPSLVARNTRTGAFESFGREAHEMLGRTPANIEAIRPLKDGVIANYEAAQAMLEAFIKKAHGGRRFVQPTIVVGVPSGITQVEKRAVRDAVEAARAAEVILVEEAMAAAVGAGLAVEEASGNVIVDIGGGTTDVAVISLAGVVWSASIRVAGAAMDDAIVNHVRRNYNLLIGERTAESVKLQVGSAYPLEEPLSCEVAGRDLVEGVPCSQVVTDEEIRLALAESIAQIVEVVRTALQHTPPELSSDIAERGIVLTGGGSLLMHADQCLREVTSLPVSHAEEPLTSVVRGAGALLDQPELLGRIALE